MMMTGAALYTSLSAASGMMISLTQGLEGVREVLEQTERSDLGTPAVHQPAEGLPFLPDERDRHQHADHEDDQRHQDDGDEVQDVGAAQPAREAVQAHPSEDRHR